MRRARDRVLRFVSERARRTLAGAQLTSNIAAGRCHAVGSLPISLAIAWTLLDSLHSLLCIFTAYISGLYNYKCLPLLGQRLRQGTQGVPKCKGGQGNNR